MSMSMRKWTIVAATLMVVGLSAQPAEAGVFGKLWELEKKKNAWIMRTFFGVGKKQAPRRQHYHYTAPQQHHYTPQPQYVTPATPAPHAPVAPSAQPAAQPAAVLPPAAAPRTSFLKRSETAPYRVATQPITKVPDAPAVDLSEPVEIAPRRTATSPRGAYIPPAPAID